MDAFEGLGIEGKLRAVGPDLFFQFAGRKAVCFEIEQPDFAGQDRHQIHHALHDDKFRRANTGKVRATQLLEVRRAETRRESQFALQTPGLTEQLPPRLRLPKGRERVEIQAGGLCAGQKILPAQAGRFRFQRGGRLHFVQRDQLQKRVMRRADFRRAQPRKLSRFRARRGRGKQWERILRRPRP